MILPFQFSSLPKIIFGAGKRSELAGELKEYGNTALLITRPTVTASTNHGEEIISRLKEAGISVHHETIGQEPSPRLIDEITDKYKGRGIQVVVSVGGGSVMDAGKAISALMLVEYGARHYLEGVGDKEHPGSKVPFIAMPTTSGTGSEVTKNAVLSEVGEYGFKKSIRHDNFIPNKAIIDPEMMLTCPPELTAASGMDAFTQLLESYLSKQANPLTDAIALQGMKMVKKHLIRCYLEGDQNLEARAGMALAALFSGITLAHAGLGLVHGFASPFGAYSSIPHGTVCGTLMSAVNAMTIDKIIDNRGHVAYGKYLIVSKIFADFKFKEEREYLLSFKDKLEHMSNVLEIPSLDEFNITEPVVDKIIADTSHKHHPVSFSDSELREMVQRRIGITKSADA